MNKEFIMVGSNELKENERRDGTWELAFSSDSPFSFFVVLHFSKSACPYIASTLTFYLNNRKDLIDCRVVKGFQNWDDAVLLASALREI